jgi:hypothetical protein
MPKQGDVREDGYIFKSFYKAKSGSVLEQWLSPQSFENWKNRRNQCTRATYHANIEKERLRNKIYRESNPDKGVARQAKRRAVKRNAVPKWLTGQQKLQIQSIFTEAIRLSSTTGIKHEVDHIVPLQGKTVCGLHVPWNLQVIPMIENRSKGNKHGV